MAYVSKIASGGVQYDVRDRTTHGNVTDDGAIGAASGLPIFTGAGGVMEAVAPQQGRELLYIPPYTYGYYGKDLSKIYTGAELHEKTAAGDYEGIVNGDYFPITLNGTYYDYADSANKTFSNAVMNMVFMPFFYGQYGDTVTPNHCLVCSRDCMPNTMKMRSANETWYDAEATNPMLGSALYQTLNNPENGIIKLVEQTELGPYIYAGPNGKGMRFLWETKAAGETAATAWGWGDRGKLFLPTEREVWGQDVWSEHTYGGGGNALQWPIFAGSRRHIIKGLGNGGSRCVWWCASSRAGSAAHFCCVNYGGVAPHSGAAYAHGVPLCFLII